MSGAQHGSDHHRERRRWWALIVLCLGELMIVLDTTIVNVALPSIAADLRFTETGLVWVVNAYMLTYGGLLLLGGRLGDLYGQRRLFIFGIAFFSAASLACGLSSSPQLLVAARAVQGLGGAVVSAVALSLIMTTFTEPAERAKAMGVYGFVCSGGGSIGVLLGGVLTSGFSWHWVFLVNLPVGVLVWLATLWTLDPDSPSTDRPRLDWAGALSITLSLVLAVYAIVNGNEAGWVSAQTLGLGAVALLLFAGFIAIERRTRLPLVPLGLFRSRNLSAANVVAVLFAVSMFAWFFILALYMQRVLGYSAMQVGLAFLPANIIMAVCSLGVSAWLVTRFGLRLPLVGGMALCCIGLALFAPAPVNGSFMADLLPGMVLLGIASGITLNPVLLASMSDVAPGDAGLASGLVSTSFMMGGAVGLAVLASMADGHTGRMLADGLAEVQARAGGYGLALAGSAVFAGLAAAAGMLVRGAATTREAAA